MIAPACKHERSRKYGKDRKGRQRYKCLLCGGISVEAEPNILGGMYIDMARAEMILNMLVEGTSVSVASRLTNTDPHTIIKLMLLVGARCKSYMERRFVDLTVKRASADEVWQFIGCKARTAKRMGYGPEVGDSYLFTGLDCDTKLLFVWHLGKREGWDAYKFCKKMAYAVKGRFTLSTDGFLPYKNAVSTWLSGQVDYGQVIKTYKADTSEDQRRYSPAQIIECEKRPIFGNPNMDDISTSLSERHNLSLRTCVRRMTRLTNGFSKKWANHEAAVALFLMHYNFCRKHGTIKTTPAVAHGLEVEAWSIRKMIEVTAEY